MRGLKIVAKAANCAAGRPIAWPAPVRGTGLDAHRDL